MHKICFKYTMHQQCGTIYEINKNTKTVFATPTPCCFLILTREKNNAIYPELSLSLQEAALMQKIFLFYIWT